MFHILLSGDSLRDLWNIYMYVCMYVGIMYVHMYVCMYVRMYVCMYVHMYVCMSVLSPPLSCEIALTRQCILIHPPS